MRTDAKPGRAIAGALVGLLYGAILALLAFFAAGMGHGTYMPLALSSAPLGAFGFFAGLFGAPLVWAVFGWLAALPDHDKRLRLAQILALLHYASGLVLVVTTGEELSYLTRALRMQTEVVVTWAVVYLVGQVALWHRIGRRNR